MQGQSERGDRASNATEVTLKAADSLPGKSCCLRYGDYVKRSQQTLPFPLSISSGYNVSGPGFSIIQN